MATSQQFLVCDSSTLANFKSWAQAISTMFTTAGWTQTSDTGQVNWSSIASVPGSGAFVYEIWRANDGLGFTDYYVKIEYGNVSGTNCPSIRLTMGIGSNGAGTLTGFITNTYNVNFSSFTPASSTTTYECNFSYATGRFAAMMWRNGPGNSQQFFAFERSVNASGTYVGTSVTMLVCGAASGSFSASVPAIQQSILFGVGTSPALANSSRTNALGNSSGWNCRLCVTSTSLLNGNVAMDTVAPLTGYNDWGLTVAGVALGSDVIEGTTFSTTLYGATRTYMVTKAGPFSGAAGPCVTAGTGSAALLMRFD